MKKLICFVYLFNIICLCPLEAQTLVKDINMGDGSSMPREFITIGNKIYFAANDGINGSGLWVTDGTNTGTKSVKQIISSNLLFGQIDNLTNYNGLLLFWAYVDEGYSLFKSDGTAIGTIKIGTATRNTFDRTISIYNNHAYYIADGNLWKSDGSIAGTVKIKSINATTFRSVAYNGFLYFTLVGGTSEGLWRTDGTEAGTVLIKKIPILASTNQPVIYKNKIYFIAPTTEFGSEIWVSDGTELGTKIFMDLNKDASSKDGAAALNASINLLFFVGRNDRGNFKLWKSDGTEQGTSPISSFSISYPERNYQYIDGNFRGFEFKNKFYFFAITGSSVDLFESDGTESGSRTVHQLGFGTSIRSSSINNKYVYAVTDSLIYFSYLGDPSTGTEVWATNGTQNGLRLVKDIWREYGVSSLPQYFTKLGNTVYFAASSKNVGIELWKSDGTELGTSLVKNINERNTSSGPGALTKFGNNIIFIASDGTEGTEVWKTDGTSANTQQLNSIIPGLRSGLFNGLSTQFLELNNRLFFLAYDSTFGEEIRYIDNSSNKINLLKDITFGNSRQFLEHKMYPFKNKRNYRLIIAHIINITIFAIVIEFNLLVVVIAIVFIFLGFKEIISLFNCQTNDTSKVLWLQTVRLFVSQSHRTEGRK
jgi:trimeric autotransporter adhesin